MPLCTKHTKSRPDKQPESQSFISCVADCDDPQSLIKIGFSTNPKGRIESFRCGLPRVAIVATIPGGREKERGIHSLLERYRDKGEWFKPAPPVLNILRYCQMNGDVPSLWNDFIEKAEEARQALEAEKFARQDALSIMPCAIRYDRGDKILELFNNANQRQLDHNTWRRQNYRSYRGEERE